MSNPAARAAFLSICVVMAVDVLALLLLLAWIELRWVRPPTPQRPRLLM